MRETERHKINNTLTMTNNKVTLHRVFTASPEKVYKASINVDAIPVEMCFLGWQESLEKLKKN